MPVRCWCSELRINFLHLNIKDRVIVSVRHIRSCSAIVSSQACPRSFNLLNYSLHHAVSLSFFCSFSIFHFVEIPLLAWKFILFHLSGELNLIYCRMSAKYFTNEWLMQCNCGELFIIIAATTHEEKNQSHWPITSVSLFALFFSFAFQIFKRFNLLSTSSWIDNCSNVSNLKWPLVARTNETVTPTHDRNTTHNSHILCARYLLLLLAGVDCSTI